MQKMSGRKCESRGAISAAMASGALALLGQSFALSTEPKPQMDWPMWGRTPSRNMVSPAQGAPETFDPGRPGADGEIDPKSTKNVKWSVPLGSNAFGNPVVAGGRVYVGTNNEKPRDPTVQGDFSILLCFEQATGKFLWQMASPKLPGGDFVDFGAAGLCSTPTVEGDRLYLFTNRSEVICLDDQGQAIWRYNMAGELGVSQLFQTAGSVLIVGDRLYAATSNGQTADRSRIPSPKAPALICLDKKTGKLLAREDSGICERMFYCNWCSPALAKIGDRELILFGGGDGFLYGFDPIPAVAPDGHGTLKELWRCDANPPQHETRGGQPISYANSGGPSEIIGMPVFVPTAQGGSAYVDVGQESASGDGDGCLSCINVAKALAAGGDATKAAVKWRYPAIHRSISTVAVAGGLVFAADIAGTLHCVDANTGKPYWTHETNSECWSSPLVADGKVYLGNENGTLTVLEAAKGKKIVSEIALPGRITCTPVIADGVMYIATESRLYAVGR